MAYTGHMKIEGKEYSVLFMTLETHQTVDDAGRPSSPVQWSFVYLELEWMDDDFLLSWAKAPNQTYDFEIEQMGTNGKYKEIRFEKAYCTEVLEKFSRPHGADLALNPGSSLQNFITCLFVTAGTIKVDDVDIHNY